MNPTELERLLLLEQTGELSAPQRRQLDAELAASAEARRLRDGLRHLADAIPDPAFSPAPDAARRIAERLGRPKPVAGLFRPAWRPALAAAAALALLFGLYALRTPPAPVQMAAVEIPAGAEEYEWTDPLDAEFAELETLLLAISTDDAADATEL